MPEVQHSVEARGAKYACTKCGAVFSKSELYDSTLYECSGGSDDAPAFDQDAYYDG